MAQAFSKLRAETGKVGRISQTMQDPQFFNPSVVVHCIGGQTSMVKVSEAFREQYTALG